MRLQPITRKERFLYEIVGWGETAPKNELTTEELFFAKILGRNVTLPDLSNVPRYYLFLAKIAGENVNISPPTHVSPPLEFFLAKAAGMDIETPVPITKEEIFWAAYMGVETEIEGIPPLTFNAIAGTLENYRIYGNTVNGESVGDKTNNLLSVLPGDRTNKGITYENKNNLYMQITGKSTDTYSQTTEKNIFLQAGTYYIRFFCDTAYKQNLFVLLRHSDNKDIVSEFGNGTKFTLENDENIKIIIGVIQSNVEINTDLYVQIAKDIKPSTFEPYGYRVPVTINSNTTGIYLPYQIRKVGDDAEYVDYGEQKQHRVRKNLLQSAVTSQTNSGVTFTVNENGGITCNGTSTSQYYSYIEIPILLLPGQYRLNGCPLNGKSNTYRAEFRENGSTIAESIDIGNGAIFTVSSEAEGSYFIRIQGNYTVENKTFYPMIRKADITDDAYEPYIENTELDITLPALPTLSGTNTLSFETTVQPSKVKIKTGKFGTHKVRYYDSDGTFLSAEDVKDGTNAQGFTPTKASTAQYNYTFMGWSTTKGSTIAETGVLNDITADKLLYAVFSQSLRTFTVYFYNGSTLLQTAENVQYGGTATYTGETPTKDGFAFTGWLPSNVNITADTSCYAQFVEG